MNPRASVDIDAPIDRVWAVMLDTGAYGEWNPFVVRAECATPPKVGDPIKLHVRWANGRGTTSPERISEVDPPHDDDGVRRATLTYVYEGLPSKLGLVRGTRHQRLSQTPDGPTRYETVEEFSGPLVALAGPRRVEDGFRRHAEALKARCEELAATQL
jgi:uncharacterized protein YndB with AHSA1/START domain